MRQLLTTTALLLPQAEVATALESFFRVGATGGGKTNDRFDALMQARYVLRPATVSLPSSVLQRRAQQSLRPDPQPLPAKPQWGAPSAL